MSDEKKPVKQLTGRLGPFVWLPSDTTRAISVKKATDVLPLTVCSQLQPTIWQRFKAALAWLCVKESDVDSSTGSHFVFAYFVRPVLLWALIGAVGGIAVWISFVHLGHRDPDLTKSTMIGTVVAVTVFTLRQYSEEFVRRILPWLVYGLTRVIGVRIVYILVLSVIAFLMILTIEPFIRMCLQPPKLFPGQSPSAADFWIRVDIWIAAVGGIILGGLRSLINDDLPDLDESSTPLFVGAALGAFIGAPIAALAFIRMHGSAMDVLSGAAAGALFGMIGGLLAGLLVPQ